MNGSICSYICTMLLKFTIGDAVMGSVTKQIAPPSLVSSSQFNYPLAMLFVSYSIFDIQN